MFVKRFLSDDFILLLYVDDMFIIGNENNQFGRLKMKLAKCFSTKDLSPTIQR